MIVRWKISENIRKYGISFHNNIAYFTNFSKEAFWHEFYFVNLHLPATSKLVSQFVGSSGSKIIYKGNEANTVFA